MPPYTGRRRQLDQARSSCTKARLPHFTSSQERRKKVLQHVIFFDCHCIASPIEFTPHNEGATDEASRN